jgi:hypothetical protein
LNPREPVSINVRALAASPDTAAVDRLLSQLLRPRPGGDVSIRVTLARNQQGPLLVAEMRRGDEVSVLMSPYETATASTAPTGMVLDKRLLWEQPAPILDLAVAGDSMIVLDTERIGVYTRSPGSWAPRHGYALPHESPLPRDPRGRLVIDGDRLAAYLPGSVCRGRWQAPIEIQCDKLAAAWPLGPGIEAALASQRNFFEHPRLQPFFSAARIGHRLVVAHLEGQARAYEDSAEPVATLREVGSEVATLPACGDELLLASQPSRSSLAGFRISGNGFDQATPALDLPGPLTALWVDLAVVRANDTSTHAAYRITADCGR